MAPRRTAGDVLVVNLVRMWRAGVMAPRVLGLGNQCEVRWAIECGSSEKSRMPSCVMAGRIERLLGGRCVAPRRTAGDVLVVNLVRMWRAGVMAPRVLGGAGWELGARAREPGRGGRGHGGSVATARLMVSAGRGRPPLERRGRFRRRG